MSISGVVPIFKIQDDRTNTHDENLSVTKFEETNSLNLRTC